jgi:hypothetical protein
LFIAIGAGSIGISAEGGGFYDYVVAFADGAYDLAGGAAVYIVVFGQKLAGLFGVAGAFMDEFAFGLFEPYGGFLGELAVGALELDVLGEPVDALFVFLEVV